MTQAPLVVTHVIQPAPLCPDLHMALDRWQALLGIYPSHRNRLPPTGVDNAVYAFANMTFLEPIAPYDPRSAAMRQLERHGAGWFMLSVDLAPLPEAEVEVRLREAGVRIVLHDSNELVAASWHLHPRDAGGVLLNLIQRRYPDENRAGGHAWRRYVATNTRVVHSILGVSIVSDDLEKTASRYTALGFSFDRRFDDAGDAVLQANLARGTFLQVRSPTTVSAPSAAWLARHGPGMFHMAFAAPDLDAATARITAAGAGVARTTQADGTRACWTDPETTLGLPLEFRATGDATEG